MSSTTKSKRQSQAVATRSTPQPGPSTPARVASPVSPTRKSRIQEKNELATLNNRFAAIIERNQQLESENSVLVKQIAKFEEVESRTKKKVEESYNREIGEARSIIDSKAKENTKLNLENQQQKKDLQETKDKLAKKTNEYTTLQNQLAQLDAKYADAMAKNNALGAQKDQLAKEVKELKDDLNKAKREIDNLRQQLEQESVARVSAENQLKAKNEDLIMKNRHLEEEVHEVKTKRMQELQEVDGRLQQEYEVKLQDSIQELRDNYETALQELRNEMDSLESQKNADSAAQLERYKSSLHNAQKELTMNGVRIDELTRHVRDLDADKALLTAKVAKLEQDISEDRNKFARILAEKDADIDRIASEKATLIQEYQDLMDTKVQLTNEIATYRKLLETEEKRLDMKSPAAAALREMTPTTRATPLRGKRKRGGLFAQEAEENAFEFVSDSISHGDIEIASDDPEGLFIRLRNKSDKELSITGYQLIRLSGSMDTTHKFGRGSKIPANGTLTIWSANATGAKHEPPHDVMMKEQSWYVSEHYKTVLLDNHSTEQAVRETKKEQVSHQRRRVGYNDSEDLFHQEGEQAGQEKCVIM